MKAFNLIAAVLLTVVLTGCISSLNPLYTEDDLVFNADLLGEWSAEETQLTFSKNGDNAYYLISSNENEGFKTHLVKLKNFTFLDIYPLDTLSENYLYQSTHFPVHTFFRIEIEKEQITVLELDSELLYNLIESNTVNIPYVISREDRMLLTASTEELQDLVQQYEELFINPVVFRKKRNPDLNKESYNGSKQN